MSVTPLEKAKQLSCWKGVVKPTPLNGGLSNYNYVVEDSGGKYVVRIGGDAPMHNVMRFNEYTCGRAAEVFGITPKQIYTEPDVLNMDFIEGGTFDVELVHANLNRILESTKQLHISGEKLVCEPVLGFNIHSV